MSEGKESESTAATEENARVGYQVAIDLWTYQGQLNWNRFNVMLVANSVIVAVIGTIFSGQRPLPYLTIALAAVGLILCIAWVLLTARGFDYHTYWDLCAWELEKQHLSDAVKTVSRLHSFSRGKEVSFKGNHTDKTHRFGRLSRVSQRPVAYSVIVVFAVMYITVVAYDILVLLHIL